jgi:hypothetical protein
MKRVLLLVMVIIAGRIGAQEEELQKYSLGLGVEGSMNSTAAMALGGTLGFSRGLTDYVHIGLKAGATYDFDQITVIEGVFIARWYLNPRSRVQAFFQADLGASVVLENRETAPTALEALTVGVRLPLGDGYVEPYIRGGYPFMAAVGILKVYTF